MDAKTFLRALAAVVPGAPSAARTSMFSQFAPRLAADTRHMQLTAQLADMAAIRVPEKCTYPQLIAAVRAAAEHLGPMVPRAVAAPTAVERDPEREDRDWWAARIEGWRSLPSWAELENLHGMHMVLTGRHPMQRGRVHPRPAILDTVLARVAELEAAGVTLPERSGSASAPPRPSAPTDAALAVASASLPPKPAARPQREVDPRDLLAANERAAKDGHEGAAIRAASLRKKLGMEASDAA